MPDRSRLSILLLHLPPEHHVAGSDFWAGATGRTAEADRTDQDRSSLGSFADGWHVEIQRTGDGGIQTGAEFEKYAVTWT